MAWGMGFKEVRNCSGNGYRDCEKQMLTFFPSWLRRLIRPSMDLLVRSKSDNGARYGSSIRFSGGNLYPKCKDSRPVHHGLAE